MLIDGNIRSTVADCLAMSDDKVLLLRLYEKTSAKGNSYFAGRMGLASVVMMRDLHTEGTNPVWQMFASEPRQAATDGTQAQKAFGMGRPSAKPSEARKSAPRAKSAVPAGQLNDDIADIDQ